MSTIAKEVVQTHIEEELKKSYLDYAMSVIVSRALPDVHDGLKPVHRRILYAMHELGNEWNKPYKKSARIVGDVIGKYHPHSDTAIYDSIVRMAQPFSLRYPLIDGQGNFGSIDGDSPAAMRYTEIRMSKIAHALLTDIEKDTVDYGPNYDGTELIPVVLPTRIPNLLINGSSGIAVGMATNIPPHNMNEILDACIAMIDNPQIDMDGLLQYVKGPDFPTAGIIQGKAGILQAYRTGQGHVYMRARSRIEVNEKTERETIIVSELPYQVNKAVLLEKIAENVKEKKIEGISGLRDESDQEGMRIVIEVKRDANAEVVLNNLYAHTQMRETFGVNMVALQNGQPKLMNLKDMIDAFLYHRKHVVTRRTLFELRKAKERAHILEGLGISLTNIDEMIALIKKAPTPNEAKDKLLAKAWTAGIVSQMLEKAGGDIVRPEGLAPQYGLKKDGYWLSPEQAQAILDLKLQRLTGLEQDKIFSEYEGLLKVIADLNDILANYARLMEIIRNELLETKEQFGDARRTEIVEDFNELTTEDLIPKEDMVVTLSHTGYVKSQPVSVYHAQRRGGKGKMAAGVKEDDFIERLIVANSHDTILCFSDYGKVYWLKVYQIPQANRQAKGRPLVNLLQLAPDESVHAFLPIKTFDEKAFVFMVTMKGVVKKVSLDQFSRPRSQGIIAIDLDEGDRLVAVDTTTGSQNILLFNDAGKVIHFSEQKVRPMGRTAHGVRGMRLGKDQRIIALVVEKENETVLTATENGYGKRSPLEEYRLTGRGGQGVIAIKASARNGKVVSSIQISDQDELMLISNKGTLVRTRAAEISVIGRTTQGVRLINIAEDEKLIGVARVAEVEESDSDIVQEGVLEETAPEKKTEVKPNS